MSDPHFSTNEAQSQPGRCHLSHGKHTGVTRSPGREEAERGRRVDAGLSKVHNSTLASAIFYPGGSLLKVTRDREAKEGQRGGKRGKITNFSKASRRRLMYMLAKLDKGKLPLFVTLTLPDEYYQDRLSMTKLYKIFARFKLRFDRRYPGGAFITRKEFETRKSGQHIGAIFPHLHLLVYGVEDLELFRGWLQIAWWEVCGKLSTAHLVAGTSAERIRSPKGVMSYASKYMAKVSEYEFETGRMWWVHHPERLPFVRAILVRLEDREAVQLIRYMKRYARLQGRNLQALTIFCDPGFWLDNLVKLLYPT